MPRLTKDDQTIDTSSKREVYRLKAAGFVVADRRVAPIRDSKPAAADEQKHRSKPSK